jgi:hypothetical protein
MGIISYTPLFILIIVVQFALLKDLLTKAFDVGRFQYLVASIGMLNL